MPHGKPVTTFGASVATAGWISSAVEIGGEYGDGGGALSSGDSNGLDKHFSSVKGLDSLLDSSPAADAIESVVIWEVELFGTRFSFGLPYIMKGSK
jgi:hypothetical protein